MEFFKEKMSTMNQSMSVNEQIKHDVVMLILDDGKKFGDVSIYKALDIAKSKRLDLIEVVPAKDGQLPVCKIGDYGKIKYKMSKKNKHQSKHMHTKEIRIGMNTDDHDLDIKNKKVLSLLGKGHKVRYVMQLKNREKRFLSAAKQKMLKAIESFCVFSTNGGLKEQDSSISVMLSPKQN